MRVCAKRCFGNLPQVALTHIEQRVRLEYSPSISFFDLLRQLIMHILHCGEGELESILALRMRTTNCLGEYLDDPDIGMLIEDTDRKDLEEFRGKSTKQRVAHSEFAAFLKSFREARRQASSAKKPDRPNKRAAGEKRKPVNIPQGDDITIVVAESMLPPDWKLQHDQFNARWRVCDTTGEHAGAPALGACTATRTRSSYVASTPGSAQCQQRSWIVECQPSSMRQLPASASARPAPRQLRVSRGAYRCARARRLTREPTILCGRASAFRISGQHLARRGGAIHASKGSCFGQHILHSERCCLRLLPASCRKAIAAEGGDCRLTTGPPACRPAGGWRRYRWASVAGPRWDARLGIASA